MGVVRTARNRAGSGWYEYGAMVKIFRIPRDHIPTPDSRLPHIITLGNCPTWQHSPNLRGDTQDKAGRCSPGLTGNALFGAQQELRLAMILPRHERYGLGSIGNPGHLDDHAILQSHVLNLVALVRARINGYLLTDLGAAELE